MAIHLNFHDNSKNWSQNIFFYVLVSEVVLISFLSRYVGINASDINFTAGRYGQKEYPLDCGLEVWHSQAMLCNLVKNGTAFQPMLTTERLCIVPGFINVN